MHIHTHTHVHTHTYTSRHTTSVSQCLSLSQTSDACAVARRNIATSKWRYEASVAAISRRYPHTTHTDTDRRTHARTQTHTERTASRASAGNGYKRGHHTVCCTWICRRLSRLHTMKNRMYNMLAKRVPRGSSNVAMVRESCARERDCWTRWEDTSERASESERLREHEANKQQRGYSPRSASRIAAPRAKAWNTTITTWLRQRHRVQMKKPRATTQAPQQEGGREGRRGFYAEAEE